MSILPHAQYWAACTVLPTTVVLVALLSQAGCLVKPHALNKEEVRARAVKDFQAISSIEELIAGPIDLYEAIARALEYSLDAKVKAMQVQLAHQQLNITHYSLLP